MTEDKTSNQDMVDNKLPKTVGGDSYNVSSPNNSGNIIVGKHNNLHSEHTGRDRITQEVNLDDFMQAFQELRKQLNEIKLDERKQESVNEDVEKIEKEVERDKPDLAIIESTLERIQKIIGNAAAIGATAMKLGPYFEKAILYAQQVFR